MDTNLINSEYFLRKSIKFTALQLTFPDFFAYFFSVKKPRYLGPILISPRPAARPHQVDNRDFQTSYGKRRKLGLN